MQFFQKFLTLALKPPWERMGQVEEFILINLSIYLSRLFKL